VEIPDFKFIPSTVSVYLYYAGRNRKYMTVSRLDNAVFLDLPGFITDEDTFINDENIIRSLNRSAAVRRNLRSPENFNAATGLADYPRQVPQVDGRVDRSFSADFGNVRTLFVEIKTGDIIIMTPEAHYDNLLIGEITSDWNAEQTMTLPDQGANPLPYREVRWLAHSLTRRDFPARVARRMQNRKAISRFDPNLYDEIFKYVYPRYIWGNTSKLDVFAPSYSSADPTVTLESSFLIKYAVAAYAAILKDEIDRFHSLPLEQAAREYFDPALVIQIAQAFGSPGGYLAKVIGTGAAITIAAILSLALSDESQTADQAKHAASVRIGQIQHDAPQNSDVNWNGIHRSVTVGNVDELRIKYGREARAKLGLTLHGELPPQLTAVDGERQHD
jgi:hypothetical protein